MKQRDFIVIGSAAASALAERVAGVHEFPSQQLIEKPGWSNDEFARPTGTVIAATGRTPSEAVFRFEPHAARASGSFKVWQTQVAVGVKK